MALAFALAYVLPIPATHRLAAHAYTGQMLQLSTSSQPLFASCALALALLTSSGQAAGATARASALQAAESEVIVAFKPQADVLRKHVLSARAPTTTVQTALEQRAASLGQRVGRTLASGSAVGEGVQIMRSPGVDATTLARQLAADPEVAYAVPNGRKYKVAAPNDPLYAATSSGARPNGPDSGQWYLRAPDDTIKSAIHIEAAWTRTTGSANVVVAVLDTGVRFEHPDLGRVANGGKLLPGYDMVSDVVVANDGDGRDADPSDPGDWVTSADRANSTFSTCDVSGSSWHGTATSALVAAAANTSPAAGMAGAAPGVRVLPVRVLGKCFGNDSDILAGMRWAAGISVAGIPDNLNPAKVINMSLGGGGSCNAAYQAAVDEITARGVTIVAAAGNSAGGPVSSPASCRGVVAVLALRHAGSKVGFSDLGPEIAIAAPGGNCINITAGSACLYPILSATNTGSQGPISSSWTNSFDITVGTSFSSPLVAGVVALMVSQQPTLSVAQVRSALQSSARPFPTTGADNGPSDPTPVAQCRAPATGVDQLQCYCNTSFCGAGMLDAGQAVAAVSGAFARIDVTTTTPTAGASVSLSATGSLASPGSTVTQYSWSLSNGGGVVTGFSSATNASTATLLPTAGGNVTVQLTVTDSAGQSNTTSQLVAVAAAPAPAPAPVPPAATGGGGGGASSGVWVAGVGLAAALLQWLRLLRFKATRAVRQRRLARLA